MMKQLNPPIPVVTPKGTALAHMVIDSGIEHDLHWVCFLDKNGECWTFSNPLIRAKKNITQGRDYISPFYNPDDVAFSKDEEDDECSEEEFSQEYEKMIEENEELKGDLKDAIDQHEIDNLKLSKIKNLIKDLIDSDQVFPEEIPREILEINSIFNEQVIKTC